MARPNIKRLFLLKRPASRSAAKEATVIMMQGKVKMS
jgi:hypothetical protein